MVKAHYMLYTLTNMKQAKKCNNLKIAKLNIVQHPITPMLKRLAGGPMYATQPTLVIENNKVVSDLPLVRIDKKCT